MPLFEIPGWSIPSDPVVEHGSKKRKRFSSDTDRLESMEVNLEKLVKKLKGSPGIREDKTWNGNQAEGARSSVRPELKTKRRGQKSKTDDVEQRKKSISLPKPLKAANMDSDMIIVSPQTKVSKRSRPATDSLPHKNASPDKKTDAVMAAGLTTLQKGMKQSLDGARFRLINETLYKTDSLQAHKMMLDNPKIYEDYHIGFRHQVELWPTNPVLYYVSVLSSYPSGTVIADLGCGDAAMARALIPKGMTVLSFDLVSDGAFVVEADICTKIPLPGSEGTEGGKLDGEGSVVDVAVCALSLMGTNWPSCLRETWRILKTNGELKIAEVASRFTDVEEFLALVQSIGFELNSKDDSNSHFTLFEFRKIPRKWKSDKEWSKITSKSSVLKPCEYKRR
ncbi:hypothetical protein L208DRAFT_1320823 [Tricholoma matsutake]|nr:hypothetical protein L208DRAFT_1320823 [Tricholoma matsutake 945]